MTNTQGVNSPESKTLNIDDDDATPSLSSFALDRTTIDEGETATLTVTLNGKSSAATIIDLTVSPENGGVSLSSDTLTFPARSETETLTVTVAAVENDIDADSRTFTISATVKNDHAAPSNPSSQTLTVTDNDDPPTVVLVLNPDRIAENGGAAGASTVSARHEWGKVKCRHGPSPSRSHLNQTTPARKITCLSQNLTLTIPGRGSRQHRRGDDHRGRQ